jgi:hypothetical protein
MYSEGNSGEGVPDIIGCHPVFGVIAVIVVAVNRKTVRAEEIFAAAVMVTVFRTYIIVCCGFAERVFVRYSDSVRIRTVAGITEGIGVIKSEIHSVTS